MEGNLFYFCFVVTQWIVGISLAFLKIVIFKNAGHQNRDTPYSARKPEIPSIPPHKASLFAGDGGIEPPTARLECAVMPLN